MSSRLTEQDEQGNWGVKGLPWKDLCEGNLITKEIREKLYGCLAKLKDYENTGLSPQQAEELMDKDIPDINVDSKWIPVSERLPDAPPEGIADEDCPEYLVMIKDFSVPTTLYYSSDGSWFDDNGYVYKVIAWMPLPEPYKEAENETD